MIRKHFHTFDAFRFFSFLLVFLLHLPKTGNQLLDFFLKSGGIGVHFFFTLSGFLITYILLFEKKTNEKVLLKNFFIRRMLRIWPLFYLMIAFAYLSPYLLELLNLPFENDGYKPNLIVSLLFCENYKMMLTGTFPDGAPLRVMWSLCVEEHFYIIWGLALYFIKVRKVPFLIVFSIFLANLIRLIYSSYGIASLDVFSNLDFFAFGAIPAYILICKKEQLYRIEKIPLSFKYLFLFFTIVAIFSIPNMRLNVMGHLSPFVFGLLFSTVILFTLGENSIRIKDDLWFSKLGTYTYGLYLYHSIVILLFMQIFKLYSIDNWILLVFVTLLISVFASIVSYNLIEKRVIKLKRYFY